MIRAAVFFFVCVILPGGVWNAPAMAAPVFDSVTAASVWGAALSYIAPRALQQLSIPQMTIWGLNGLAALDPDLSTTLANNQILLNGPEQLILSLPAPAPNDATAWGKAAAQVASAAYAVSPALQQAGTQGVISSFFDELFNHFDPYSRYEPPLQAAQDQLMITGIASAGLSFGQQGNNVVIASIAAGGPAEDAGLTTGTQVLKVDGKPVYPGEITHLNNEMSGIYGTTTSLQLQDPTGGDGPQDVTITRAFIPPQTVFSETPPVAGVVALRISGFNKGTGNQFSSALAAAMSAQPPPDGLLLDLRGNRGGILRQAILVADSLLQSGAIVQTAGRDPDADQSFSAEGADLTGGIHIVVLVDGQTASAAEILSAALADNHRAVVVGSETLGKGLVQTVTTLPDGGELFVTWSRVLAPRGWPLQSLGVMPQVCTSLGPAGLQTQLNALKNGQNLMAPALAQARATRANASVDAILSIRDACPADTGSDQDSSTAGFLLTTPQAYQAALLP